VRVRMSGESTLTHDRLVKHKKSYSADHGLAVQNCTLLQKLKPDLPPYTSRP
jgi:hypothetical protein